MFTYYGWLTMYALMVKQKVEATMMTTNSPVSRGLGLYKRRHANEF